MGTRAGPPPDNIGRGKRNDSKKAYHVSDYEQFLDWVARTQWSESYGIGWMMEKLRPIIFQMPANQYVFVVPHS